MVKKDLKSQLSSTVKNADNSVKSRIAKADALLNKNVPSISAFQVNTEKAIRDNFTMPPSDYDLIEELRSRFARMGNIFNKSEVLRAGLHALAEMNEKELQEISQKLTKLKRGRVTLKNATRG